ncbi:carbon-nitrogen hydrolase family protein [Glaciihabitans arcticus]|uniref:Carbon-nitrogen hydrolase family protein n=1 Tax=Glaciihabitans arcticus TaxID=2668039 RepID=A0A4Q9GRW5_9MICO|nr:carbon-nitrogen hydrolase family protein [Glaciihabitans arcticus]TBN57305.1 carbon-nitrogen hydrolase family protein [Glaciihabitans arcticus]
MTTSGLAVVQFAPMRDVAANLATMNRLAELAVSRGASLVVFPEYSSWFTPDMDSAWLDAAQDLDGEFVIGVGAMSVRLGIHVVAGFIERTDDPARISNTLVALDPQGAIVATYSKLHLYDAFGGRESDWVKAGAIEDPQTFAWGDFTVGLQTCYDLRFPEVTRRIVDAGADLVLVPSEWVRGPLKEHHWRTLITARAIENTVYVAAADHAPPIGAGNSMVVDPMGVEIATIGEIEDVAVAWPLIERVAAVRVVNPSLAHRRFGIVPGRVPRT